MGRSCCALLLNRQEVVSSKFDAKLLRGGQQLVDALDGYQPTCAALAQWLLPLRYPCRVRAEDQAHFGVAAELCDNACCWFHIAICSDDRYSRQAYCSDISGGRCSQPCATTSPMNKESANRQVALKPINQWVVDALAFSGLSQSDLATRLAERRVITSKDRSFVNKMAVGKRKVSAEEAAAISEITGFPMLENATQDPRLTEIIKIYQSLPEHYRELYAKQVRAVADAARIQQPD